MVKEGKILLLLDLPLKHREVMIISQNMIMMNTWMQCSLKMESILATIGMPALTGVS